jgi:hypothetical protein
MRISVFSFIMALFFVVPVCAIGTPKSAASDTVVATRRVADVMIQAKSKTRKLREGAYAVNAIDVKSLANMTVSLDDIVGKTAGVKVRTEGGAGSEFDLSVNGIKALTLETIDCTDTQLKLKLTPAGDLWDQLISSGLSSTVLDLAAPALEISIKATDRESNSELYLTAGGEKIVGIIAKFSANENASVELPSGNYLDGSDPDVMYEWGASFDFEALINKLTEAGVPQALLDELLAMLAMYA